MKHVAFVTCADLSAYFPSTKDPLLTHDDYLAAEYLRKKNFQITPLIWGEDPQKIKEKNFDCLLIRSPWDYTKTTEKRNAFATWLQKLKDTSIRVFNPPEVMLWNFDKHYLKDFSKVGVQTVPSEFIETKDTFDLLNHFKKNGSFVLKPTISAAARDTFRFLSKEDVNNFIEGRTLYKKSFEDLRQDRSFILQPYLKDIETKGEWSLIFLGGFYSHGVLKKPKQGHWLVQDELGGSVLWEKIPKRVEEKAVEIFNKIGQAYEQSQKQTNSIQNLLAYARIDLIENNQELYLSEVELIEPELFFLDRSQKPPEPHTEALSKLHHFLNF